MKDGWDSMLKFAQNKVEEGVVDANVLKILLEQITNDRAMILDDEIRAIIQSLETKIDENMVTILSKCKTGRDLLLRFYEELQKRYLEERKCLMADIFSEVTEWVLQQK